MSDVRALIKHICQDPIESAWDGNNFSDIRMSGKRNLIVLLVGMSERMICQGEGRDFTGHTDAGKILPDLDNVTRNILGGGIPLGMPHFTSLFSLLRNPCCFSLIASCQQPGLLARLL